MIEVQHLTKRYGSKVAIDDLSFTVNTGKVTGFLGPNGSGKSTTMRCMLSLDASNAGRVLFDGKEYRNLVRPITKIGALLDGKAYHPQRTARQELTVVACANKIPRTRIDEVLGITGLTSVADKRLKGFSLGMGARLGVAIALLGTPEILILDEPVNGLDPDGVRWIRQLMRNFAGEGGTVLVSSHLMSEMALTADELIVLGNGKLIAQGPIERFTHQASQARVLVSGPDVPAIRTALHSAGLNSVVIKHNDRFEQGYCEITGVHAKDVGHILAQHHIEMWALEEHYPSLEDVFMEITNTSVEFRNPTSPVKRGRHAKK